MNERSCERMIWRHGANVGCGQAVAVTEWQDYAGARHVGCPKHVDGLKHRYPEFLPERLPTAGKLGLATPWARGAFGPADRIEIENRIPTGWTMGVTCSPNHVFSVWALDPNRRTLAQWSDRHDGVIAARQFAEFMRTLAEDPPEPEWIESADPITAAKAERERVA